MFFFAQWLKYYCITTFSNVRLLVRVEGEETGHKFPNCTNCLDRSCLFWKVGLHKVKGNLFSIICLVFRFLRLLILPLSFSQLNRNRFMCSAVYNSLYWSRLVKCNVEIFCIIFEQTLYNTCTTFEWTRAKQNRSKGRKNKLVRRKMWTTWDDTSNAVEMQYFRSLHAAFLHFLPTIPITFRSRYYINSIIHTLKR